LNTIPTIFKEKITPYTAIGGKERISSNGISAVILNRAGLPRRHYFQDFEKTGFDNVISIESPYPHYDIEELSRRFPFVRFILPEREMNPGEQINLAAEETESPLFYVLRNDLKIIAGGTANRLTERLKEVNEENEDTNCFKRLCTIPVIVNSFYEVLPTLRAPVTRKKNMRTAAITPQFDGQLSLYPFDGIGIYDRSRFIKTGGFDITIKNTYWQFLDFGYRAYLWGESIALSLHLKLLCEGDIGAEDTIIDESYRQFFLKNLAPVYQGEYAHLPFYRFPPYLLRSGDDIFTAWHDFSKSREWIKTNKLRWRYDTSTVAGLWDTDLSEALRISKINSNRKNTEQDREYVKVDSSCSSSAS
jgi:hypothetical protein